MGSEVFQRKKDTKKQYSDIKIAHMFCLLYFESYQVIWYLCVRNKLEFNCHSLKMFMFIEQLAAVSGSSWQWVELEDCMRLWVNPSELKRPERHCHLAHEHAKDRKAGSHDYQWNIKYILVCLSHRTLRLGIYGFYGALWCFCTHFESHYFLSKHNRILIFGWASIVSTEFRINR